MHPAEEDTANLVPEWELREWREWEEERRAEAEELGAAGEFGAGEQLLLFLPICSQGLGGGLRFLLFLSFVSSLILPLLVCGFLLRNSLSWGIPRRRTKRSLPRAATARRAARKRTVHTLAMIYLCR